MKPILFSSATTRAILDGRKTCTRRLVKFRHGWNPKWTGYVPDGEVLYGSNNIPAAKAPYRPGDILYVRETWQIQSAHRFDADVRVAYAAGGPMTIIQFPGRKSQCCSRDEYDAFIGKWADNKWHPSIHMLKEAARLFLRVNSVRAERLKDMTTDSAMDEGFSDWNDVKRGWNSTIKKADLTRYGWDANPWVWVIEFERISKEETLKGGNENA